MDVGHSETCPVFLPGYSGNIFHDFNEVLLPLFQSVHSYNGEVVIIIVDLKGKWWFRSEEEIGDSILGAMTNYPIRLLGRPEDLDGSPQAVDCFSQVLVGTPHNLCLYDEEGGAEARSEQKAGVRLRDFGNFLQRRFGFPDQDFTVGVKFTAEKRPVLGFVQRLSTRKLTNLDECIALAEATGFRVVVIHFEELPPKEVVRIMRQLDVFVGVHGAAFTNLVFMRERGVVAQLMPWGEYHDYLRVGREYKNIAFSLKCTYMEYKVPVNDSSLYAQYPEDDPVLVDPYGVWQQKGVVEAMRLYHSQDIVIPGESFRLMVEHMYEVVLLQEGQLEIPGIPVRDKASGG